MLRRFATPVALLVAAPLLLAACGGDGGDSDEDQITEVITTSVKTTDPADCTKLQTQRFVEQSNYATGEDAVAQCEEDVKDTSNDPDSVEVTDISVDGDSATANVTFEGAALDGSTATVALVKDGDQWKLDELTDIPELNAEAFKSALAEQISTDESIPPQIGDCIASSVNQASDAQIKQAIVGGTEQDLVALFGDCIPGT